MANNFESSWKMNVGINNVASYQVSGRPFASGNINAADAHKIEFPFVTRWIMITNKSEAGGTGVRVGYSEAGISGSNYFVIPSGSASERLEVKVSEIWLYGCAANGAVGSGAYTTNVDVAAGMTSILPVRTSGSKGPSWSGSSGVG
mgnify:CR=1 FL=1